MRDKITTTHLTDELTNHIANEFDKIQAKFGMTYDDFKAFALGYTLGVVGTLKTTSIKDKNEPKDK